jgi:hypothetical protein
MHSIVQNSIYLIQYIQLDKKTIFDKISYQEVGLQGPMHTYFFYCFGNAIATRRIHIIWHIKTWQHMQIEVKLHNAHRMKIHMNNIPWC